VAAADGPPVGPDTVTCPHCGTEPGRPCWRRWDLHSSLLAEVPTPGYCTDRIALAKATERGGGPVDGYPEPRAETPTEPQTATEGDPCG
jgi:hypothetical protein